MVKPIKPHFSKPGYILGFPDHELKYRNIFFEIVSEDLELQDTAPGRLYTIRGGKDFRDRFGITTVKESYPVSSTIWSRSR